MAADFVDFGSTLAPWNDVETGSKIAFGSIAAPGVTGAFSVTGHASIYAWGGWTRPPCLTVEKSTDGGTTWTAAGNIIFHGAAAPNVAAQGMLTGSPTTTGTALYRLRLDGQAPNAPISWSVCQ